MRDGQQPAFPTDPNTQPGYYQHHGMTLRDYFAAQIIAGARLNIGTAQAQELARRAYLLADAMLAERSRPHE